MNGLSRLCEVRGELTKVPGAGFSVVRSLQLPEEGLSPRAHTRIGTKAGQQRFGKNIAVPWFVSLTSERKFGYLITDKR